MDVRLGKCIALYMAFLHETLEAGFPAQMAQLVVNPRVRGLQIHGRSNGSTTFHGRSGALPSVIFARGSGKGDAALYLEMQETPGDVWKILSQTRHSFIHSVPHLIMRSTFAPSLSRKNDNVAFSGLLPLTSS